MAYTTIDDPSAHFQTVLWTGDGNSTKAITNDGNSDLQPDLVWLKNRTDAENHTLADTSRGVTKRIVSNSDGAEDTNGIASIQSDGFTAQLSYNGNTNAKNYVAWQWKANGGTTTENDASQTSVGSLDSVYQANTTAGFSIVLYTGSGNAATIAHGLGVKPECILVKNRSKSGGEGWTVYHGANTSAPETDGIHLNLTNATSDSTDHWNDQAPTTTTFGISGDDRSGGGYTYVGYVFNSVQGYSKFGSYTGNGAQDGTFVYTGFKPAWIMIKRTDAAKNWYIADSKRSPSNVNKAHLVANSNAAEDTSGDGTDSYFDILSNGFKLRQDFSHLNADGGTFVYMAFAEHPFVSSEGVPCTAR